VPRYVDGRVAAGIDEEERSKQSLLDAPQPAAADIVPGHPIDPLTINALVTGAGFAFGRYRADHPEARGKKGQLRAVRFTWEPARAGTYWVRVSSPLGATPEEVAAALFGSPTAAGEIAVSAAPLFGFNNATRLLAQHQEALIKLGVDIRRSGDAVQEGAKGPLADEIGKNQADAASQAQGATGKPPAQPVSRDEVVRTLDESVAILQRIGQLGQTFGMGKNPSLPDLAEAVQRIDDRKGQLLRGDEAQALSWGAHAREQKRLLTQISFGFAGVVERFGLMTKHVKDATAKLGGFNLPPHVREAMNACASLYGDAAQISHLPASAETKLASAEARARLLPIEILEGTLASIQRTVDDARKNRRKEGGDHASYGVDDLSKREERLRIRLASLRTTLLQDPIAAGKVIEQIQQDIVDLQLETEMVGNMDQLDGAWQAVVDAADSWFIGIGTVIELAALRDEGHSWHGKWKAVHAKWKKGDKASRDQAKAELESLRQQPALHAYFGKVAKAVKSAQMQDAIGKIVALLVITIVTMGVGELVIGAAGAYGLGTGATILAVGGAEAATFTLLSQIFLEKDHSIGHIAWEFASNWAMFGVLRRFSAFAEASKLGTAATMSGQAVILGAMSLAKEEIDKYARTGKHLTKEEIEQIAIQGLVMWIALNAAGRLAQPMLKQLEGVGHSLGTKIRAANKSGEGLKAMAEALHGQRDPAKALAYIEKERAWLEQKRDAYEELERVALAESKNPPADGGVLKKSGLTLEQIQSLKADISAHADRMKAAQRMLQLEAIAPDVYTCPKEQIPSVVKDLGEPTRVATDRATGVKTYEFKGPDGKPLKIIEKVNPHEEWVGKLRAALTPEETAKLEQMTRGKSPEEIHKLFNGNIEDARLRIQQALGKGQAGAKAREAQLRRAEELRKILRDEKVMEDPDIRELLANMTEQNAARTAERIRSHIAVEIAAREAKADFPGKEILRSVKIYVEQPEATSAEWKAKHQGHKGVIRERDGHVQLLSTEIDLLVIERQPSGKARIVHREEVKAGASDSPTDADHQVKKGGQRLEEGGSGAAKIILEHNGKDISNEIDMASVKGSTGVARGPAGKGYKDADLGVRAEDLQKIVDELIAFEMKMKNESGGTPPQTGGDEPPPGGGGTP
jgi:hypothetical protein